MHSPHAGPSHSPGISVPGYRLATRDGQVVPVTFVSSSGEFGGAERLLYSLLDGLGPGWVRSVIVLGSGPVVTDIRVRGVPTVVVPAGVRWALVRTLPRVRAALRRSGSAVIHANGFRAALVVGVAALGTDLRVIWLKVDGGHDGLAANVVARLCDQVVGISHQVNTTFRGRVRRRLRVAYPGLSGSEISTTDARQYVRQLLGCPSDTEVVVLSARLCPPKGQNDLLEVVPRLISERRRLRIVLLGGETSTYSGYESLLRRRADELGVAGSVSFLGHRSACATGADVVRFVSGCDLLVAPSRFEPKSRWQEGFGLAPVEAMWVGTPVVAYRHGSFPEVLGDCALLVAEGDLDGLFRAIIRVLDDPELRARLTKCGKELAHSRYRLDRTLEDMRACYREATAIRPSLPSRLSTWWR